MIKPRQALRPAAEEKTTDKIGFALPRFFYARSASGGQFKVGQPVRS